MVAVSCSALAVLMLCVALVASGMLVGFVAVVAPGGLVASGVTLVMCVAAVGVACFRWRV